MKGKGQEETCKHTCVVLNRTRRDSARGSAGSRDEDEQDVHREGKKSSMRCWGTCVPSQMEIKTRLGARRARNERRKLWPQRK